MWIVANGALKSGSTWIYQLLSQLEETTPTPPEFQQQGWKNASVTQARVADAAQSLGARPEVFVSKQHWARDNSYLLQQPGIKVVNIVRDIRDVIVSRFHHDKRSFGYPGDISDFLRERMENMVAENVHYHSYWINSGYISAETYYVTSYEYLLDQYEAAARALFGFCGFEVSQKSFQATLEGNLFQNKPKTGEGQFFRKGRAFSFGDDLSPEQSQMILDQAQKLGFAGVKRKIAGFNPELIPYLEQTDLGLS